MLRPIASPLALGLVGLAAGTVTMSGLQLGWVDARQGHDVALILLAFVFPLQLLASVLAFLARDGIVGTSMGILACTWLSIGLVHLGLPPGGTSDALGLFLLIAAIGMLVPTAGAATGKLVPAAVFATAAARFATTGVAQLTGDSPWKTLAGLIGLGLGALAVYAALAAGLEDALRRPVLPVGRRARGREALGGALAQQLTDVHHEPGVRQQL
ncbi:MAG: hypothetical protein ACJ739_07730 [Acidimicrobiales bacterium]